MALTRVGLAITLAVNSTCTTMTVTDSTGTYDVTTNPLGYGLPSGAASADVTSLVIVVNLPGGSYFTYTFTIALNVISAATLSLSGGTATNILASLVSTVFPVTSFDLWGSYGVTLPAFEDGVIEVDYTIGGFVPDGDSSTEFNYTTSESVLVTCVEICCCVTKMGLAVDPGCPCSDEGILKYLRASAYLDIAAFNVEIGKNDTAQEALDKATELCNCSGCGCG